MRASSASGSFCTAAERRSGTCRLFPAAEPTPSSPWHAAQFARNVAVAAAPSGAGFARAIETAENVGPTKSASNMEYANSGWHWVLSLFIPFPLGIVFGYVDILPGRLRVTCRLCRRMQPAHIFPFAESPPKNLVPRPVPIVVFLYQKKLWWRACGRWPQALVLESGRNAC